MEQTLKDEVIRLINLKRTTKYDVDSMINIIREHIDKKMSICSHCAAQIRFAQKQLLNWYNRQETTEEKITISEPPVKVGCQSCKQKATQPKKGVVINTPNKKK